MNYGHWSSYLDLLDKAFTSFAMAAMTMSFYNSAIIYLLAALGAFVTIVIPSIMSIRKAG